MVLVAAGSALLWGPFSDSAVTQSPGLPGSLRDMACAGSLQVGG